jgi:hypothetical protein
MRLLHSPNLTKWSIAHLLWNDNSSLAGQLSMGDAAAMKVSNTEGSYKGGVEALHRGSMAAAHESQDRSAKPYVSSWVCAGGWQIKEVLEKYLEDEDDMLDMNLTARSDCVPVISDSHIACHVFLCHSRGNVIRHAGWVASRVQSHVGCRHQQGFERKLWSSCRLHGTRHVSFQLQRESLQQRHKSFIERNARHTLRHQSSNNWPQLSVRTSLDDHARSQRPSGAHACFRRFCKCLPSISALMH